MRPIAEFTGQYKMRLLNVSRMCILPMSSTYKSFGNKRPARDDECVPSANPATVMPRFFHVALAEQKRMVGADDKS